MRAGGAETVGSISSPGKRKAMPTIAIGAAKSDRVGDRGLGIRHFMFP